jgi:hypothetical protein
MILLPSCREAPMEITNTSESELTDPTIPPRVEFVWVDSRRPYYRGIVGDIVNSPNDPLPSYIPGRLIIRFNKIMQSQTVISKVSLIPEEIGFAQIDYYGAYSIDGQTFEWPVYNYFKVAKSYTITVSKKATDFNGRNIASDYEKIVIPEPNLRVISSYPLNSDTSFYGNSVHISFNSPIDSNSLKGSYQFTHSVPGRWAFEYYYDLRSATFFTNTSFASNTWYELKLTSTLKDTFNNYLPAPVDIKFKTTKFGNAGAVQNISIIK